MLRLLYFTLILLLLHTGQAFCRPQPKLQAKKSSAAIKKPAVLEYDTLNINKRSFNPSALKSYADQKDFQYDEEYQGISLWQRFWMWFWSLFDSGQRGLLGDIIVYLLMALGVAAIVFLILKLSGINAMNVLRGRSIANIPYNEHSENIHELNLDDEIERAIAAQNFRFAVRMLYLKCLKQLNDAGLIHWEVNKTNADYSHELHDTEQRLEFNLLTRQFEYIWYGEFNVDAGIFTRIRSLFNDFKVKRS